MGVAALVTIDTELSAGLQAKGVPADANLRQSVLGETSAGAFGVGWQMDRFDRHGVRGVFFVDPMPGLVHGPEIVERMIEPILARGHEVQIHIHTEWLQWTRDSPVEGRRGRNIGDFSLPDQIALIGWARDALVQAGAPAPTAFRAGNFGADDRTLAALEALGLRWDSSFNPDYAGRGCAISLPAHAADPVAVGSLIEIPVSGIEDRPGHFRPAQICALSAREMGAALDHACRSEAPLFMIVTHSFEMLSRDRKRPNRMVMRRLESLCRHIAREPGIESRGFATLAEPLGRRASSPRLGPSMVRTGLRMAEQMIGTWRYERRLRPA
jgi:hypothetical protein